MDGHYNLIHTQDQRHPNMKIYSYFQRQGVASQVLTNKVFIKEFVELRAKYTGLNVGQLNLLNMTFDTAGAQEFFNDVKFFFLLLTKEIMDAAVAIGYERSDFDLFMNTEHLFYIILPQFVGRDYHRYISGPTTLYLHNYQRLRGGIASKAKIIKTRTYLQEHQRFVYINVEQEGHYFKFHGTLK